MSRTIRILLFGVIFVMISLIIFQSCAISDLRTDLVRAGDLQIDKGRAFLQKASENYRVSVWDSLETYTVTINDEFYGFAGKFGNPYPGNVANLRLSYIPNSFTGAGEFTEGKNKGLVWGIQSWQTYQIEEGGTPEFKKDKDITFWLPTYQYFMELPFRILQADVVAYAGQGEMDGKIYELVFASWNQATPQKDIDQYIIWINPENNRIEKVEYTVRDMFNFLTGALHYRDFREVDGLLIPFYMPVESNMAKGYLHEIRVLDFGTNKVDKKSLLPDEQLGFQGDVK